MKKLLSMILISVLSFSMFATPVFASSRHYTRHTTTHITTSRHYTHHSRTKIHRTTIRHSKANTHKTKLYIVPVIPEKVYTNLTIYTADSQGLSFVGKTLPIGYYDAQDIFNMLSDEPKNVDVLSWEVKDNIGYLNLSKEFTEAYKGKGGSTQAMIYIYSAVNTFCSLPNVKGVQFLIEGQQVPILFEMDNGVFTPNMDI